MVIGLLSPRLRPTGKENVINDNFVTFQVSDRLILNRAIGDPRSQNRDPGHPGRFVFKLSETQFTYHESKRAFGLSEEVGIADQVPFRGSRRARRTVLRSAPQRQRRLGGVGMKREPAQPEERH